MSDYVPERNAGDELLGGIGHLDVQDGWGNIPQPTPGTEEKKSIALGSTELGTVPCMVRLTEEVVYLFVELFGTIADFQSVHPFRMSRDKYGYPAMDRILLVYTHVQAHNLQRSCERVLSTFAEVLKSGVRFEPDEVCPAEMTRLMYGIVGQVHHQLGSIASGMYNFIFTGTDRVHTIAVPIASHTLSKCWLYMQYCIGTKYEYIVRRAFDAYNDKVPYGEWDDPNFPRITSVPYSWVSYAGTQYFVENTLLSDTNIVPYSQRKEIVILYQGKDAKGHMPSLC